MIVLIANDHALDKLAMQLAGNGLPYLETGLQRFGDIEERNAFEFWAWVIHALAPGRRQHLECVAVDFAEVETLGILVVAVGMDYQVVIDILLDGLGCLLRHAPGTIGHAEVVRTAIEKCQLFGSLIVGEDSGTATLIAIVDTVGDLTLQSLATLLNE